MLRSETVPLHIHVARGASILIGCEHVFALSVKGSPYRWFKASLRRGDLAGVRAAASELGRNVSLVDALSIVLLMAAKDDEAFDRAATRWLARLALERPTAGLDDVRLGLTALEALPHNPEAAKSVLRALCARHRLEQVIGLLA